MTLSTGVSTSYLDARQELLARPVRPSAGQRAQLSALTDVWLRQVFAGATGRLGPQVARVASRDASEARVERERSHWSGMALVAVGSYGSKELSPGSDLDLLLLHVPGLWQGPQLTEVADAIWYPVWDSGVRLDHAVRTPEQTIALARDDLAVLLGLLDARTIAGDPRLLERLRAQALADWRTDAVARLPALREWASARAERYGDLAYALEPDLKSGRGGLRDLTVLRAVAASWLADRPHGSLSTVKTELLDLRDALHLVTGRPADRLQLQDQAAVAERLELADADELLRAVGRLGREVAYATDITWRRVEQARTKSQRRWGRGRSNVLRPIGQHLMESGGEVVLAPGTVVSEALLPLRAAAAAARGGLALNPGTLKELRTAALAPPNPWPPAGRQALLSLLSAGPAAIPLWEALDAADLVVRLLPEWAGVRHKRQRNPIHAWTVDRHSWETAAQAALLTRRVSRPDLLLIAALLHDLGKGVLGATDHAAAGDALARTLCTRIGLEKPDADIVCTLVREHLLLLATATRRDLDDPVTVASVALVTQSVDVLELLSALTEADARATGPGSWTRWKAGLVEDLVGRVRASLQGRPQPELPPLSPENAALAARGELAVTLQTESSGCTVTVIAPDRRGLLADVAGVLALQRLSVRSASLRSEHVAGDQVMAVDTWFVEPEYGDLPEASFVRDAIARALTGKLDVSVTLARRESERKRVFAVTSSEPSVVEVPGASESATVLEVRAVDRLGLLHDLGRVLARADLDVRAARVDTVGAEVVDVFYLVNADGSPLRAHQATEVSQLLVAAAK